MKLILDAQLPASLSQVLEEYKIDSMHVDDLPDGDETPDSKISKFADEHNMTVMTKDFDHSHMALGKSERLF